MVPCAEHKLECCAGIAPTLGPRHGNGGQRSDADSACVQHSGDARALGGAVDQVGEDGHRSPPVFRRPVVRVPRGGDPTGAAGFRRFGPDCRQVRVQISGGAVAFWSSSGPYSRTGMTPVRDPAQNPVSRLAAALRELRAAAGSPPPSELKRQGEDQELPVALPSSTVNDWLHGKSAPTDAPAFWFLVDYLTNRARRIGSTHVPLKSPQWKVLLDGAQGHRRSHQGGGPARERRENANAGPSGSGAAASRGLLACRAKDWNPYPLGVDRSAEVHAPEGGPPTYIARDHDPELRRVIRDMSITGGFIALVGEPASRKRSSAYEAVRAVLPEWNLVQARLPAGLTQAADDDA